MMKIEMMKCTCGACPTQYEGKLTDGRMFYFRYRWGYLSVRVSPEPTSEIFDAINAEEIFGAQVGDEYDGTINELQVGYYLAKAGIEIPNEL